MGLNILKFLISQNISADLKGPKEKYKLHYGRCTGLLFRAALIEETGDEEKKKSSDFRNQNYTRTIKKLIRIELKTQLEMK